MVSCVKTGHHTGSEDVCNGLKTHRSTHQQVNATDVWIESIRSGEQSPGSFANAAAVLETAQLASVALRARRKVLYDYKNMKVTNISEANNYLGRSEYREGWEI